MPRLVCTFGDFIAIITDHGFTLHRHDGTSHRLYRGFVDGQPRFVTVAVHRMSDEIPTGTLQAMIRQSALAKRLFRR